MSSEKLKSHADWLQDRADNPSTVMPGSTEPRSIVDSKRLGEIARDIREFAEDVEDEGKLGCKAARFGSRVYVVINSRVYRAFPTGIELEPDQMAAAELFYSAFGHKRDEA